MLKLAIAQFSPHSGEIVANLEAHYHWIRKAIEQKVDLLVFPELSITGSFPGESAEVYARSITSPEIQYLQDISHHISLVAGFIELSSDGKIYNAVAYFEKGQLVHVQRKLYHWKIKSSAMSFHAGTEILPFDTQFGKFGLLIGEDAEHLIHGHLLALEHTHLLINPCALPIAGLQNEALPDSLHKRHFQNQALARLNSVGLVFANRIGSENGYSFGGKSELWNAWGNLIGDAPIMDEHLLIAEISMEEIRHAQKLNPVLSSEKPEISLQAWQRLQTRN